MKRYYQNQSACLKVVFVENLGSFGVEIELLSGQGCASWEEAEEKRRIGRWVGP